MRGGATSGEVIGVFGHKLLVPQFESPQCIRICARITHKYVLIIGMNHRYIIKGFKIY
jgi:hypothetical protein